MTAPVGEDAPRVVVRVAPGCHLCDDALDVVGAVCDELGVGWATSDISGNAALEAAYRAWIPVVEVDGERAFTYAVAAPARRRLLTSR